MLYPSATLPRSLTARKSHACLKMKFLGYLGLFSGARLFKFRECMRFLYSQEDYEPRNNCEKWLGSLDGAVTLQDGVGTMNETYVTVKLDHPPGTRVKMKHV